MPPLGPENTVHRIYPAPTDTEKELNARIDAHEDQVYELMTSIIPPKNTFIPHHIGKSAVAYYETSEDGTTHQAAWLERNRSGEVRLFTELYERRESARPNAYYRFTNTTERVRVFKARGGGPGFMFEGQRFLWRTTANKLGYDAVLVDVLDTLALIADAQKAKNLGTIATSSENEYYRSWHIVEV